MNKKYLLAIDGGTGSIRSCLFDTEGNQIAIESREWTHLPDERYPGSMDFDCVNNWELTKQTIKGVLTKTGVSPGDILSVAASSMREGIVLYDDNNNEIFACANVDARAGDEVIELNKTQKLEEGIYKQSGQTFSLGAIARILWVKNHMPAVYEKTAKVNMLNDWLSFKLSGRVVSEPSNGCTTGIFDLKKRDWAPHISKECSLKPDIFPPVYECGRVIGNISEKCAGQTGLSQDTLVVSGGGDAQLAAVGTGVVKDGQSAVFGGSFWQFEHNTSNLVFDDKCRIRINCHAVPDMWQYEAIAFFPGLLMKWYKNAFCGNEMAQEEKTGKDAYTLMEEKAAQIPPGCYGMVTTFSDVMNYISWRHAAPTFTDFAFDADKFNRYTFYRSIMESAAFVTRGHMELVTQVTGRGTVGITFAGGASKSPLWCQILADVMNVPVSVPYVKEATALGAAVLAGIGAGVYNNAQEAIGKFVKTENTYAPNPANRQVYDDMYKKWIGVYKAQLKLADSGRTRYMWNAPGAGGM